nr:LysM peptidoglycan-binding domain-containing protein [uncultured Marinifilum sp.]
MNCFFRSILLVSLLFGTINIAFTQSSAVEISKNKVVVGGKTYLLHIVKEKQTLFSISKAYGVNLSVLMKENRKTQATVNFNEVLRIPFEGRSVSAPLLVKKEDAKYIYHIVKEGETLFSLSKKYNLTIDDLKAENKGVEQSLPLNSVLKIPKNKKVQTVEVQNVPKHDKKYYYYVIKPGDTQYSIAKEFLMKQKKLRKLNPKIKGKLLKIGDWVRIPRYLVPPEYFVVKETPKDTIAEEIQTLDSIVDTVEDIQLIQKKITIGLFLPLYLETNDTINQTVSYRDTLKIITERNPRVVYRKSKEFIRFYQGVLLAVDSLRKEGLSVDLHLFDTEKNPAKVKRLIARNQFVEFDFLIGPVYQNTFAVVAKFAKQKGIPIISPLSGKNPEINSNPYVIQLNTSLASVCRQISEYVCEDFDLKNVIVVHPERYKHLNEYKLIKDIEHNLFEKGLYWNNDQVNYKKISFDEYGLFGIEALMCDTCENIVVLPSNDQPLVENIITNLNVLSQRFAIRLIGFSKWQRYNSLESELFYNLNFSLFSPYYIDYKEEKSLNFVADFRERFCCEPSDFSFRAYDMCRYFALATSKYGKEFPHKMNNLEIDLLQSAYHFKRITAFGGFENRGVHLINYSRDFKIRHQAVHNRNIEDVPEEIDLLHKSFEY